MRKYTTPTLEVVKLLVKEDMAAKKVTSVEGTYESGINTTTYNLARNVVSEANPTPTPEP